MFDPASRFHLVDQAVQAPGMCIITKATEGPFIDTGLVLNKFDSIWAEVNMARIYLSVDVLREMAEGAGLFDEERERSAVREAEALNRGWAEGVNERGDLAAVADRVGGALDRFRAGTVGARPDAEGAGVEPEPDVLVVDGEAVGSARASRPAQRAARGQGDGPRRSRRPAGVSGDSGDGADNPFRI